jgi:hypothetical protein
MSTASTLRELKSTSQDFEWYPTTDEIIKTVCRDMDDEESQWHRFTSMLDVGAGDGRVLTAINASRNEHDQLDLFGIEKAVPHLSAMPKDITVVGTDLMEQSLLDKDVSVTFCNPPYSEYNPWMRKIIRETQSSLVYFVVPRRWKDQQAIECLIQDRDGDVETLGEFDFSDADREARCHVELIRISFGHRGQSPFDSVVEEMLPELDQFTADEELEENVEAQNEVAEGSDNIVERLVKAYDAELGQMISDYRSACSIKQSVLKQLGIEKSTIVDGIRNAVKTMKNRYWEVLFSNMKAVTSRLATRQRAAFLQSIKEKVSVDFTESNCYAFLIWVSKWSNDYYDEQLINLFHTLSNDSNAVKYKSNDRVWTKGDWRYHREETAQSHYRLEYRMVVSHGGISTSEYDFERTRHCGLQEHAYNLLADIVTVANNLGFASDASPADFEWESNKQNKLMLKDGTVLCAVRAFKNGNMHIHFAPKVALAINVEAGRLLGWIRTPAQAADEFEATDAETQDIESIFGSSYRLGMDAGLKLGFSENF